MKAIVVSEFGGAEQLKFAEIARPEIGSNEVRVKLFAAGVNPAETYVVSGNYAFDTPELPFTPGYDGAGVIEEVGDQVTDRHPGERVFVCAMLAKRNTGTYAEAVVCDANSVFPLPDHISYEQGAAIGVPAITAYRAIYQKAQVKAGEIVLVHGASGGVGSLVVQMLSAMGAIVIGTASSPEGKTLILANGGHYAIDHISPDNQSEILAITQGRGPDVIIEMLANVNLATDLDILAKYGRIVIIGNRGSLDFNPRQIMAKDATIYGTASWHFTDNEYKESLYAISSYLKKGIIQPNIGERLPLAAASQAHQDILNHRARGKMILLMNE